MSPRLLLAFFFLISAACAEDTGGEPDPLRELEPCESVWGEFSPEAIYVWAGAERDGDGSFDAPFTDIAQGLDEARARGTRRILVGPGEYGGKFTLSEDNPAWRDGRLEIAGCGVSNTSLTGVMGPHPDNSGDEILQPVLQVTGASTADVLIRDLTVAGGRRAVTVEGGAGSTGPIVLERIDVVDSVRLGVLISGFTTVAHLIDVRVDGVDASEGFGWGISVQTSAGAGASIEFPTVLEGVTVDGASGVGILADGAFVEITATTVTGVAASSDGSLGRGFQLQQRSFGRLDSVVSSGNRDSAVYLHKPGRAEGAIAVNDCILRSTAAGTDGAVPSDGLAISQGEEITQPPSSFGVEVSGTEFAGNGRSDLLVEGVAIIVDAGNSFDAPEPFVLQGGAVATGAGLNDQPPTDFGATLGLDMIRQGLGLDDLIE